MDINVQVRGQKLRIITNLKGYAPGSQNFVKFIFNFSEDWDGLSVFAQFSQGGIGYNQYLDEDGAAFLPHEITTGQCTLMLYGTGGSGDSTVIATTNYIVLTLDRDLFITDAESTDISESLYTQLVNKVNNMEASIPAEIDTAVPQYVTAWLDENITQPTTPVVDASLSVEGAAADAKATGDAVDAAESLIDDMAGLITDFYDGDWYQNITGSIKLTKKQNTLLITGTKAGSNAYYPMASTYATYSASTLANMPKNIQLIVGHRYRLTVKKDNDIVPTSTGSFQCYDSNGTRVAILSLSRIAPTYSRDFIASADACAIVLYATSGSFGGVQYTIYLQDVTERINGFVDHYYDNFSPMIAEYSAGYVDANGVITGSTLTTELHSQKIPVSGSEVINISTWCDTANRTRDQYFMIGYYANDNTFIKRDAGLNDTVTDGDQTIDRYLDVTPDNAAQMIISFRKFGENMLVMAVKGSAYPTVYNEGTFGLQSQIQDITHNNNIKPYPGVRSINHRGWHECPENTLVAYKQSKIHGFDFGECDVRFTSDNVPVLLHDASINRTARNADGTSISDTVNIASITYEEALTYDFGIYKGAEYAGTTIPTLAQYLSSCRNLGLSPYIEIEAGFTKAKHKIIADIVKASGVVDEVTFISSDTNALRNVMQYIPNARYGLIPWTYDETYLAAAVAMFNGRAEVFLDLDQSQITDAVVSACADASVPIEAWTPNAAQILTLSSYVSGFTSEAAVAKNILYNMEIGS